MSDVTLDRGDPGVRAALQLARFERRQRTARVVGALVLFALAAAGPFVAAPLVGDPGATFAAVLASLLFAGCGVVVWPWTWTADERRHHERAAVWSQARADADEATPWDRFAAWADVDGERVELALITCAGSSQGGAAPSPFSARVVTRLDAEAVVEATAAMEALREEAVRLELRARDRHLEAIAAAARKPYDDALRDVDEAAEAEQRRAEARMRRELAEQEAGERRAQAAAVARALRRP